jgi:linoleoyl-CoA desaturase
VWLTFFASKAAHVALVLAMPMMAARALDMAWLSVLGLYFLGQFIASCGLVALILGTHWADVSFFKPDAQGQLPHTWHAHSFYTAVDWMPRPKWLGYWLGGLNAHLTHHLFPSYSHRHYPALAKIVASIASEQGLVYRELNYAQLFTAQQRFLKEMGQSPFVKQ